MKLSQEADDPIGEGVGKNGFVKGTSYCLSGNSSRANEETRSCLVKKRRKRRCECNVDISGRNDNKCIRNMKASRSKHWWIADNGHPWLKKQNSSEQGARSDKGSTNNTTESALGTATANTNSPTTIRNSRPFSPYAFESRRKKEESGTFHALPAGRSILGREAQGVKKNEPPNKITCGLVQVYCLICHAGNLCTCLKCNFNYLCPSRIRLAPLISSSYLTELKNYRGVKISLLF